ncbi:MAG: four helix bundle protein [Brumimicrobium sp.]|nr:four helix bundle protein [Brumimicrobium sp.]
MKFSRFEEINAWQKAKTLTKIIYQESSILNDYSFKNQIQRASLSIMNNIAEGFERISNKEFVYFLYVSKGSCGEVRSMVLLGEELGYFDKQLAAELHEQAEEISKMIAGLIKSLK